jgi:DNA replication protein DnaC
MNELMPPCLNAQKKKAKGNKKEEKPMLNHPTLQQLKAMKLDGMAQALQEQIEQSSSKELSFEERLGLLIDREVLTRDNRGFARRVRNAKLKQQATLEDLDYKHPRNLDAKLIRSLTNCEWVGGHHNLIVTGPTGVGKTYLACALAHQACRQGYSTLYAQTGRLLQELWITRGDGRYLRTLAQIAKTDVLILDDWGLDNPDADQRRILLEILDDRYDKRSTLITSQFPTELWYENLADPTLADAILDRILHNAYRLELKGESLRKKKRLAPSPDLQA